MLPFVGEVVLRKCTVDDFYTFTQTAAALLARDIETAELAGT